MLKTKFHVQKNSEWTVGCMIEKSWLDSRQSKQRTCNIYRPTVGSGAVTTAQSSRGAKLNTHLRILQWLKTAGAVPTPSCACAAHMPRDSSVLLPPTAKRLKGFPVLGCRPQFCSLIWSLPHVLYVQTISYLLIPSGWSGRQYLRY